MKKTRRKPKPSQRKHDGEPSTPQEDSNSGNHSNDVVLDLLKEAGLPLTRENYLNVAYFGDPPKELGPEEEADLPPEIQLDPGEEL